MEVTKHRLLNQKMLREVHIDTAYANHHSNKATTKSEGSILMIRSFFISRILIPSPISKIPPTLVRPCIISGVKKVPAYIANRVMPP